MACENGGKRMPEVIHLNIWLPRELTKSDKLSKQAAQRTLSAVRKELEALCPGASAQLFSSLKNEGIDEATRVLSRFAIRKKQSPA
jgi:GTP-binding protein